MARNLGLVMRSPTRDSLHVLHIAASKRTDGDDEDGQEEDIAIVERHLAEVLESGTPFVEERDHHEKQDEDPLARRDLHRTCAVKRVSLIDSFQ